MGFFDVVVNPNEVMRRKVKTPDMNAARINFALAGVIWGILFSLLLMGVTTFLSLIPGLSQASFMEAWMALSGVSIILFPILFAIVSVVSSYIFYGSFWFVATKLGGKGTFEGTYYLASLLALPSIAIYGMSAIGIILAFVFTLFTGVDLLSPSLLAFLFLVVYVPYLIILSGSIANTMGRLKSLVVFYFAVIVSMLIWNVIGTVLGMFIDPSAIFPPLGDVLGMNAPFIPTG